MKYELRLSKQAQKDLDNLQKKDFIRMVKALRRLEDDPQIGFPLLGKLKDCWRLRAGAFGIIYAIDSGKLVILVIAIGHRREIYRG